MKTMMTMTNGTDIILSNIMGISKIETTDVGYFFNIILVGGAISISHPTKTLLQKDRDKLKLGVHKLNTYHIQKMSRRR